MKNNSFFICSLSHGWKSKNKNLGKEIYWKENWLLKQNVWQKRVADLFCDFEMCNKIRRRKSPVTLLQEVRESTPVQTRHNVVRGACALESWEVGGGGAAASGATSCQGRWMKPRGWRDQAELEGGLVQLIGTRTRVLRLKKSISSWYSSSSFGYLIHSLGNCVMTLPIETGLTCGPSCGPLLHEACHTLQSQINRVQQLAVIINNKPCDVVRN